MKQWLSYLLIILFSLQVLPVKELGKMLLKKAATGQSADDNEEESGAGKDLKEKTIDKLFLTTDGISFRMFITDSLVKTALHYLCHFKASFYPDITTPPPDKAFI